jgi:hypothetical protein
LRVAEEKTQFAHSAWLAKRHALLVLTH